MNAANHFLITPALFAASNGHAYTLEVLLMAGSLASAADSDGQSVMDFVLINDRA